MDNLFWEEDKKIKTVIGIAGVKTAGKSTVANIIKELLGNDAEECALADRLKNTCAKVFNLNREYFDLQELKEVPFENPKLLDHERIEEILKAFNIEPSEMLMNYYYEYNVEGMLLESPRHIAQIVGTEVLRAAGDEDIHCKNMEIKEGGITIVSDLRFPNEFEYFVNAKDIVFLPIYVQRNNAEKLVTKDSHLSEASVFLFSERCFEVNNNSSLEDLKKQVAALLVQTSFLEDMPKQA